jgi:hypothetical protein
VPDFGISLVPWCMPPFFLIFVGFFCFFMFFPSQEIKDSIKDLHSGAMAAPGAAAAAVMSA